MQPPRRLCNVRGSARQAEFSLRGCGCGASFVVSAGMTETFTLGIRAPVLSRTTPGLYPCSFARRRTWPAPSITEVRSTSTHKSEFQPVFSGSFGGNAGSYMCACSQVFARPLPRRCGFKTIRALKPDSIEDSHWRSSSTRWGRRMPTARHRTGLCEWHLSRAR